MKRNIEKATAMAMAALAMFTSCGTQKKAQDATAGATGSDIVISRPEPGTLIDSQYLIYSDAQRDLIAKNNGFALNLFRGTAQMASTVVSPLSVTYLMGMLANGADGATRDEIMTTIGAKGTDLNELNGLYHFIMTHEAKADKATTINIANFMAVNKDISLKAPFTNTCKEQYEAGVESMDFASPKSAEKINNWCKKQTDGMIPSIISSTDASDLAYIMNAIYFNGTWTNKFEKSQTKEERFRGYTRNIQTVKMMHQNDKFLYTDADGYSAVRLPYGSEQYAMTILLPHNDKSISDIMDGLTAEKLQEMQRGMRECVVDLKLPRFSVSTELTLNDIIAKLGAPSIFAAGKADFSNMSATPMSVSKMLQKAKIEVSEEGTKAAAVTAAIMTMSALNPNEPQHMTFHADHPFVYMITERNSGAIFFIGQFTGGE